MHLNEIREGGLLIYDGQEAYWSTRPRVGLVMDSRPVVVISVKPSGGYSTLVQILDQGQVLWVYPSELEPYDEEEIPHR